MAVYAEKLISSITVGAGGASNIIFSNIPQTYTDLVVKFSTAEATTGSWEILVDFNGTSTNRTSKRLRGNGASATSSNASNILAATDAAGAVAFGSAEMYIPNYTSSNYKSVSIDSVAEYNSTEGYNMLTAGLWSDTSAITSIKLYLASGNIAQYSTAYLYGITGAGYGAKATGGIITSDSNYYYHTFLSTGTFIPSQSLSADILVVAGGGGTGAAVNRPPGGGGAGGFRILNSQSLNNGTTYTATIGAGGAATNANDTRGGTGSNSTFAGSGLSTITSSGGGGGGNNTSGGTGSNSSGASGGSGGGATGAGTGGAGNAGSYSPVEGYRGGNGENSGNAHAGGGGGAGGAGTDATSGGAAGNGGIGSSSASGWGLVTNTGHLVNGTYYYAGGGGAGAQYNAGSGAGTGGYGGGGNGGVSGVGVAGTANTGGGAGAPGTTDVQNSGSSGGSGIVIVRYAK